MGDNRLLVCVNSARRNGWCLFVTLRAVYKGNVEL